jgi:hypothetical protein
MQLFVFLSLLAAVRAAVVAALGSSAHFHSPIPLDTTPPQGKNITINGVLTYVSLSKGEYDLTVAVLMFIGRLTSHSVLFSRIWSHFSVDVFGLPSPDNLVGKSLAPVLVFFAELFKTLVGASGFNKFQSVYSK